MTGGRVVVLGKTGRNFAAGMSGGIAYVYDPTKKFRNGLCNMEMVELEAMDEVDRTEVHRLILTHADFTGSEKAKSILNNWKGELTNFVKVIPTDYKKALEKLALEQELVTA
jgi:glutamate synthase (ferredoxin)